MRLPLVFHTSCWSQTMQKNRADPGRAEVWVLLTSAVAQRPGSICMAFHAWWHELIVGISVEQPMSFSILPAFSFWKQECFFMIRPIPSYECVSLRGCIYEPSFDRRNYNYFINRSQRDLEEDRTINWKCTSWRYASEDWGAPTEELSSHSDKRDAPMISARTKWPFTSQVLLQIACG